MSTIAVGNYSQNGLTNENGDISNVEGDTGPTMDGPSVEDSGSEEWTTLRFMHAGKELSVSVEKSDRYVPFQCLI